MADSIRTLRTHLQAWAGVDPRSLQVVETIQAIANAATGLSAVMHRGDA